MERVGYPDRARASLGDDDVDDVSDVSDVGDSGAPVRTEQEPPFFTAAAGADTLNPEEWGILVSETRPRNATDPDGRPDSIHDSRHAGASLGCYEVGVSSNTGCLPASAMNSSTGESRDAWKYGRVGLAMPRYCLRTGPAS